MATRAGCSRGLAQGAVPLPHRAMPAARALRWVTPARLQPHRGAAPAHRPPAPRTEPAAAPGLPLSRVSEVPSARRAPTVLLICSRLLVFLNIDNAFSFNLTINWPGQTKAMALRAGRTCFPGPTGSAWRPRLTNDRNSVTKRGILQQLPLRTNAEGQRRRRAAPPLPPPTPKQRLPQGAGSGRGHATGGGANRRHRGGRGAGGA